MSNSPPPHASPALSLTLGGIFGAGGAAEAADEGSNGNRGPREGTAQITSNENSSGLYKLRSNYGIHDVDDEEDDEDDENNDKRNKRRKKYNRHTPEQVQVMEALFKEFQHPDEKQRQQLSNQLGLHPKQVKFWFQNRRTQVKAIQERDENTLLKSEIEKLRHESRNTKGKSSCPNCGFSRDVITSTEEQQLRIENSRLKAEVEKLRSIADSDPLGKNNVNRSSLDFNSGDTSLQKSGIMDAVNQAMDELQKMATYTEQLWVKNDETGLGRDILNYNEYMKLFCKENSKNMQEKKSIEASRESVFVFVDLPRLVQIFMDVNQWREMFPCLISKAVIVKLISNGDVNRDGAVQLMFVEIQMLTTMVATREMYFVRYCKQLSPTQWGIVDVSIDNIGDKIDASLQKCRKRPSGCIIEVLSNVHCKVTWVEHLVCQKSSVHSMYLTMVNSGLAFGAKHWISTLQQQCERILFLDATDVPKKDSFGVATLAGRKSLLILAQRMTRNFCRTLGASSHNPWNKFTTKTGEDIRLASRKNANGLGEPLGTILSAATSVWLPVSHQILFNFLTDEKRRNEWDVMSNGNPVESTANLAKGRDRKNEVTVLALKSKGKKMLVLQDSSRNDFESMVVYAPMEIKSLKSVMLGCDSSKTAVLASGFSILPGGIGSRPSMISKREKDIEGGSLLTIAFQMLISDSPTVQVSRESVDSVNGLISCTLQNIKKSLECEE